jgi:hypothetical protein
MSVDESDDDGYPEDEDIEERMHQAYDEEDWETHHRCARLLVHRLSQRGAEEARQEEEPDAAAQPEQ